MNLSHFDSLFEDYLTKIVLTKRQADTIDNVLEETIELFFAEYSGDVTIYSQGSYAMGTVVRPLTEAQSPTGKAGEYDVDIVLERDAWGTAQEALKSARNVLSDEYAEKVDKKLHESCERVFHKINADTLVRFHVDYVPIKNQLNGRNAAKRTPNEWFISDTKQLVEWFSDISDENVFLPSMIMTIKRMRDYADLVDTISSICITALVCNTYQQQPSYADDLLNIVDGIIATFNVPHSSLSIKIEPLEDDLADRIDEKQHRSILEYFKDVKQKLEYGFSHQDLDVLRSVLSTSFPADMSNFPDNLEALRNRGWSLETSGSLRQVEISESGSSGSFVSKVRKRFYGTGGRLIFHANEYDKHEYGIRWQVLNAEDSPKRRGNLFEAKSASGTEGGNSNKYVNHETESYLGEHWIKYYIYNKQTKRVVEIGEKFFVEVDKTS